MSNQQALEDLIEQRIGKKVNSGKLTDQLSSLQITELIVLIEDHYKIRISDDILFELSSHSLKSLLKRLGL